MKEPLGAGKGQEKLSRAYRQELSPVNNILGLAQWDSCQTSELQEVQENRFVLFKATKSAVIC